jgi:P27 family predicted phage terminase small subunit
MPSETELRSPPDWLSDAAREIWLKTEPELPTGADLDQFAVYCCTMADYLSAQQSLDKTGQLVRGPNGGLIPSPLHRIKLSNANAARQLARSLGIGVDPSLPALQSASRPIKHRNQVATERTLKSLRAVGRIDPIDAAAVALARTLAEALDRVDPETYPAQMANLARAQLAALRLLRGSSDDDNDGAALSDFIAAMSTEMGDAEDR